jgi:FMN reductase
LDYALRPLLNYLHAHVVPTGIFQATEDLGTAEGARIRSRIERAATQLADQMIRPTDRVAGLADAPKPGPHSRPTGIGVDEEFLPFEEILSQYDGKH